MGNEELYEKMQEVVKAIMNAWNVIKEIYSKVIQNLKDLLFMKSELKTSRQWMNDYYFKLNFYNQIKHRPQVILNKPRQIHARTNC